MKTLIFLIFSTSLQAQYVLKVQKQVLSDVLNSKTSAVLVSKQDSVLRSYQKELSSLVKTVDACRVLNTDYLTQISYLKQINFDSNKEIIILTKEKKRLKRQTFWLKVLIPVAVGSTMYLMK